jgi:hypothetical protein
MRGKGWRSRPNSMNGHVAVRDATSLVEAVHVARKINRRVLVERNQAAVAVREAYLRRLMGLPARPPIPGRDDGGDA